MLGGLRRRMLNIGEQEESKSCEKGESALEDKDPDEQDLYIQYVV